MSTQVSPKTQDSNFSHLQSAHCESGVLTNLLQNDGADISEAMVFGVGSGIFFGYMPFVKVNYLPLTTFRTQPGAILKKVSKRLNLGLTLKKFRNENKAQRHLDELLRDFKAVGAQVGIYWLPFIPD